MKSRTIRSFFDHFLFFGGVVVGVVFMAAVSDGQVRSIDGSGNNLANPEYGAIDTPLMRFTTNSYGDGLSTPAGTSRPSTREASNALCSQTSSVPAASASDFVWQWGQFLDHDIDITENAEPHEPFDIPVPLGDPFFDPFNTGNEFIFMNRSVFEVDDSGVRQQINQLTTWIDGSNVYGSDTARANELRSFSGGRLKTSAGNLLPFNINGFLNAGGSDDPTLFLAGDVRANEQSGLTAMHTLFMREHNFYADIFSAAGLNDEDAYQQARILVWAELQAITFNEFLPVVIGKHTIPRYDGYDDSIDPSIANFFSTASFRFGHSMLNSNLLRLDDDLNTASEGNLQLLNAFFSPNEIIDNDIDSLLRGLANQHAQNVDTLVVDDVRNFLFGPPGAGGFDLPSLNMQRGRDHGLPDYNQARVDYGLDPVTSFSEITSDPSVAAALQATYGTVDDIDPWVGGLAEDHQQGAIVGELIQTVMAKQFTALRDGDRFWYENVLSPAMVNYVNRQRLSRIIKRNTNIGNELKLNVFRAPNN